MNLKDKVIVITGAGRGIGRAVASEMAAAGAHVALMDVNEPDLAETQTLCRAKGVRTLTLAVNVANESQVNTAFDRVVAEFGRLDGLLNNAGILRDALLVKARDGTVSGKMSLQEWQAVIDVNLTGVFLCGREAAERMVGLGHGGVIINMSSVSRAGNPGQSNYAAAKAGVAAMTVVWARELARHNIRVGAIAPGATHTPILGSMRPEMLEKMLAPVPLHRLAEPGEIAHAARFIFENEYFSGRVLEIDGGMRL